MDFRTVHSAIEAAHAGEAGRGFAVVADEIRKLAETSTVQSKTIKKELAEITGAISEVVGSKQSTIAFQSTNKKVGLMESIVRKVGQLITEQSEGSKQILEALRQLNMITQEVRGGSAEMSMGNKAILNSMEGLFNVSRSIAELVAQAETAAQSIRKSATGLRSLADKTTDSIRDVKSSVDCFKTEKE